MAVAFDLRVEVPLAAGGASADQRSDLDWLNETRRGLPPLGRGEAWHRVMGCTDRKNFAAWCLASTRRWIPRWPSARRSPAGRDYRLLGQCQCAWRRAQDARPSEEFSRAASITSRCRTAPIASISTTRRAQTAIIRPAVIELTAYNTDQVVMTVNPGTLIVFSGRWPPHLVDRITARAPRISVGFNVMFAAFAQTMGSPVGRAVKCTLQL